MKKLISLFTLLSIFSLQINAYAEDNKSDTLPSDITVTPIKRYQASPMTGVVLSPGAVGWLVAELNSVDDKVKVEVEKTKQEEQANTKLKVEQEKIKQEADKKVLQSRLNQTESKITALEKELKNKKANTTTNNNNLLLGVGFGAGILTTVLVTYLVTQSTK